MLLDAALTSLQHMGLWMLPVPWQPEAGGLLEPPLAAGMLRLTTPHFAQCFLALLRNQRLHHSSQGVKAELPSPMWGTPAG